MKSNNFYLGNMHFGSLKILALSLMLTGILCQSCSTFQNKKAVELNDSVIEKQRALMHALEDYIAALDDRDDPEIRRALDQINILARSGKEHVANLEAPECAGEFLKSATEMFEFYETASIEAYDRIAGYYELDSISYEGYDSLMVLYREVEEQQQAADRAFIQAQKAFASSCGFKLVRNVE